jgi:excisionase family DNA binding protein
LFGAQVRARDRFVRGPNDNKGVGAYSENPRRGWTPSELAALLRVSPDKVRGWIHSGELKAINVAKVRCGRPQYIILPHHLEQFERGRQAAPTAKVPRRRKRASPAIDYFPD